MDDLPRARAELGRVLRENGFRVEAVASVAEGVRVLEGCAIAVVVADLRLLDPDGNEGPDGAVLLEIARRSHPGVKRVVLTADPIGAVHAQRVGGEWVDKEDDARVLVEVLRRLTGSR